MLVMLLCCAWHQTCGDCLQTHCSCGKKYGLSRKDPFSIMQVPMLKSTQVSGRQTTPPTQPLKDGLDVAMCSPLDEFNECVCPPGSRPDGSLFRTTTVETPPAVLTLQLQRFDFPALESMSNSRAK